MTVDPMWPKRKWYQQLAARIVAKMMLDGTSYQCSGKINWELSGNKADIQVPGTQMAHWILRQAGYNVAEIDVIEHRAP